MAKSLIDDAHLAYEEGRTEDAYLIACRVLADDPQDAAGWNLISRVNLCFRDRLPEALSAGKRLLELRPDDILRRRLGIGLIGCGFEVEGRDLLESFLQENPDCSTAAGRLLEHRLDRRDIDGAKHYAKLIAGQDKSQNNFIGSDHGDFQLFRLRRLEEEIAAAAELTVPYSKIIAVCSVSYSGSTFFGELLGRLDNATYIGESHALTKGVIKNEHGRRLPISAANATTENLLPCSVCGPGKTCKTYDEKFRRELIDDQTNWYKRILDHGAGKFLIASDKNFNNYVEHDPLQRFDAVVLFKSPLNSFFSQYKRSEKNQRVGIRTFTPQEYLKTWKRAYEKFLYGLDPTGEKLYLSWELFTSNPFFHLRRICELLNIEFDHDVLEREQERDCCFGGNFKVVRQFQKKRVDVLKESRPLELPASLVQEIEADAGAARVYAELRKRYFEMF